MPSLRVEGCMMHAGCLYGLVLVLHDGEVAVGAGIRQLEVLVEGLHGQVAFQSSARRFHGGAFVCFSF